MKTSNVNFLNAFRKPRTQPLPRETWLPETGQHCLGFLWRKKKKEKEEKMESEPNAWNMQDRGIQELRGNYIGSKAKPKIKRWNGKLKITNRKVWHSCKGSGAFFPSIVPFFFSFRNILIVCLDFNGIPNHYLFFKNRCFSCEKERYFQVMFIGFQLFQFIKKHFS